MIQKHSVTIDELNMTISTGDLAGLAGGAVTVNVGETCVFVSTTAASTVREGQDWFPLTVDYREKYSAAGRIPGGYFKREARPTEKEILTSRLCDRPCRPLFPKGFLNEVQIIGFLLSTDKTNEPDISMLNGASAALAYRWRIRHQPNSRRAILFRSRSHLRRYQNRYAHDRR